MFIFFNDTATTEIYTLSLHDALPIYLQHVAVGGDRKLPRRLDRGDQTDVRPRSLAELRSSQELGPPSGGAGRAAPRGVFRKAQDVFGAKRSAVHANDASLGTAKRHHSTARARSCW